MIMMTYEALFDVNDEDLEPGPSEALIDVNDKDLVPGLMKL